MAIACETCQRPVALDRTFILWEHLTPDTISVIAGYCSDACADRDDSAWAPVVCAQCQRTIRSHVPTCDVRDADSRNFCLDPAGRPICRACAPLRAPEASESPTSILPAGWTWMD